jgi:Response regulator of the LytR/AlgR family
MQIVICDDEEKSINYYEDLFKKICRKHDMQAEYREFKSGDQLLFNVEEVVKEADIVFLDIKMPGTNGLEVAQKLRGNGYEGEIIFLTMSKEAVFYAFDVHAANYLVKDVSSEERIEEVLLRAIEEAREKKSEYLLLTGVGEYRNVPVNDIRYFEIMQKIVTVYYAEETFEFVSTMGKLENLLFTKGFVRISRSFLVSTKHISAFSYEKVTMDTGSVLPVGRKYYKSLKDAMKGDKRE